MLEKRHQDAVCGVYDKVQVEIPLSASHFPMDDSSRTTEMKESFYSSWLQLSTSEILSVGKVMTAAIVRYAGS